jgi:hypothetical protein
MGYARFSLEIFSSSFSPRICRVETGVYEFSIREGRLVQGASFTSISDFLQLIVFDLDRQL